MCQTSYLTFESPSSSFLMAFGGSPRLAMPLSNFVSKLGLILEAISNIYVKSINLEERRNVSAQFLQQKPGQK